MNKDNNLKELIYVLIDVENVKPDYITPIVKDITQRSNAKYGTQNPQIKILAVADWTKVKDPKWADLDLNNIEYLQHFNFIAGSNASDMCIAMKTVEIINLAQAKKELIKSFAIISNDSDFVYLTQKINSYNIDSTIYLEKDTYKKQITAIIKSYIEYPTDLLSSKKAKAAILPLFKNTDTNEHKIPDTSNPSETIENKGQDISIFPKKPINHYTKIDPRSFLQESLLPINTKTDPYSSFSEKPFIASPPPPYIDYESIKTDYPHPPISVLYLERLKTAQSTYIDTYLINYISDPLFQNLITAINTGLHLILKEDCLFTTTHLWQLTLKALNGKSKRRKNIKFLEKMGVRGINNITSIQDKKNHEICLFSDFLMLFKENFIVIGEGKSRYCKEFKCESFINIEQFKKLKTSAKINPLRVLNAI